MQQKKELVKQVIKLTEATKNALSNFIVDELRLLTKNVANNYNDNIQLRKRNPFLAFENTSTEKFMALGRSIDSQLGNRMQNIIFYLARIRYGASRVPNIINILVNEENHKITIKTFFSHGNLHRANYYANTNPCQQNIYINADIDEAKAKQIMKIKKTAPDILGSNTYVFENVHQDKINYILSLGFLKRPVDLLYFKTDETSNVNVKTFEIKMSGLLDTKNAESNANEVHRLKEMFSYTDGNQSYFASCYGECSDAVKREILKILTNESILNSTSFWAKILPIGDEILSYEEFIEIYANAFVEAGLEERIIAL